MPTGQERPEPILLRIPDAASLLGLSRSMVYEMAQRGEIPTVRIGRTLRIPSAALRTWAERLQSEQNPPHGR